MQEDIRCPQREDEVSKKFKELEPDRKTSVLLNKKRVEKFSVSNDYSLFILKPPGETLCSPNF